MHLAFALTLWLARGLASAQAQPATAGAPDFLREVRPILSGYCFKCHGQDAEKRKSNLRFDVREEALKPAKSGKTAIVPKQPDSSELMLRIHATDEDDLMPPAATKHPLNPAQKDVLKRWIEAGAEYAPHWAFQHPVQSQLPTVRQSGWPSNPIDHFLLQKMEAAGLAPAERADHHALIRRLSLDLTGLAPTPEQVDAFLSDSSPNGYENLVDRLLASPHYGERWARRWLDLARYADTNGYEKDRPRSIWPYRDWVIGAINGGKSFRDFTIEQIAGDLLAAKLPANDPARTELQIATGFHRNTMINEEGGADPQEFRFYSMVDRVHVTATTWLGLTFACAQCHTHKYDPIQQSEYYQFMAFLNNADEPWIDVPRPETRSRRDEVAARIARLESELAGKFPVELNVDWLSPAQVTFNAASGAAAERQSDNSLLLRDKAADKDEYTLSVDSSVAGVTHLQLGVLPDASLAAGGPGRSDSGNFVLSEIEILAAPVNAPTNAAMIRIARASADGAQPGFPPWNAVDGRLDTGWGVDSGGAWHVPRTLTLEFAEPMNSIAATRYTVRLKQEFGKRHLIGRMRLSLGHARPDSRSLEQRQREHLERRLTQWIEKESHRVSEWFSLAPADVKGSYPTLTIETNNTVFVSGDFTKSDLYTVGLKGDWKGVRAFRLEVLPDDRLPNRGPGRVNYEGPFGDFFLSDFKLMRGAEPLKIASASDSFHQGGSDATRALDDDLQSGWSINGGQGRSHNAVFVLEQPLDFEGAITLKMLFERYYAAGLGKFRLWATRGENPAATGFSAEAEAALVTLRQQPPASKPSLASNHSQELEMLRQAFVHVAPELAQERAEIDRLTSEQPKYPTTLVMAERPPGHVRPTRVHKRGEFLQPGAEVDPGLPAFLPSLPPGAPRNRLGFAQWLVSDENPLTARVVMNREWQGFFGRGLVRTMEDFGFQGELPSHPELLDWLAVEFMKRQWSIKAMHKLMVMSAAYRQSSRVTPVHLAKDPENLLLSRAPRLRLEAELVRDGFLAASGLLSDKLGGPSVYPPQLASITTEGAYGPLQWNVSTGVDRYRRSLYTFSKRTAPFAMLNTFDAPSGEACLAKRDRSNTPLQSLTLLNDEAILEMTRALGTRIAQMAGSIEDKLSMLFRRCLTRPPTVAERQKLLAFHAAQLARFSTGELKAAELMGTGEKDGGNLSDEAAWTAVARVLFNLDETITKS